MASAFDVFNGPVWDSSSRINSQINNEINAGLGIDTSYQFGDWITGRSAAKQTQANQARLDYNEWMRNEASAKAQRDFEEYMDSTKVQRSMVDLKAAGLNPWLAVQSAGFGGSTPTGAAASSSAGQLSNAGTSSPGSILAGTAVGLAAILKVVKAIIK